MYLHVFNAQELFTYMGNRQVFCHTFTVRIQYRDMTRIKETKTSIINCYLHQISPDPEPKRDYNAEFILRRFSCTFQIFGSSHETAHVNIAFLPLSKQVLLWVSRIRAASSHEPEQEMLWVRTPRRHSMPSYRVAMVTPCFQTLWRSWLFVKSISQIKSRRLIWSYKGIDNNYFIIYQILTFMLYIFLSSLLFYFYHIHLFIKIVKLLVNVVETETGRQK